jgi:two-component system CheB/CheR fusion protein
VLLRAQTSHDFSQYKPSTINRRIERRMAVNQIEGLGNYVRFLQQSPAEIDALFNDMLIGVTNFFRDKEAFSALETQVIPKLFADKPVGSLVRVWVPGCSTGEEAYSIAILLLEHIETIKKNYTVQIFATDIDSRAIATARTGLYPVSIASDITPERLARFFTVEPGGNMVRVLKTLRDVLLFSEQDIIKDPPFSKLDLISCRNLMIYLNASLQKRLIPLFHYALNPDGILFLGNSEGVGEFDFLFAMLERKAKLYQRKENIPGAGWQGTGYLLPLLPTLGVASRRSTLPVSTRQKHPLRELTEKTLLQKMAPPSVLINVQGDILYQHGRIGMYMEPAPGEAGVGNVLRMAREGLRPSLDKALYQAASTHEMVQLMNLNIKTNGHYTLVNLSICPVKASHPLPPEIPLYLLIFEEAIPAVLPVNNLNMPATDGANSEAESIAALKLELRAKDEYLRSSNEEMEASNEELKSANEEMQSVNEEMQSTNEELETSREEMQSLNEELATVNVELQIKLVDLARANNDMNNLLAGTGIATVFVDHQMCILRFTPFASQIINLILSDVGRPVSHIASNLVDYPTLLSDVQAVLKTLVPKEVNVHTIEGRWYTMRILPYRTLDNVIEGAVITFVDITEMKKAYEEIIELKQQAVSQQREVRYQSVISALSEPVVVHARNGEIVTWNPAAERIFGLSGDEIRSRKTLDLRWQTIHEDGSPFLGETRPVQEVFRTGKPQLNATMGICKPSGEVTWVLVNSVPMFDVGDALPSAVVVSFEDITERKKIEKALRKAHELNRLAVIVRDAFDAVTMQDLNGRILAWNPAAEKIYGWSEAEALQMNARDRIPPQWQEDQLGKLVKLSQAEILQPYLSQRLSKNGELLAVSITSTALLNETGEIYAIATTERLISEVKNESPR